MNRSYRYLTLVVSLGMCFVGIVVAQDSANPPAPSPAQGEQRRWSGQEDGPRPLFGKITAIHDGALEIARPGGQTVTVKTSGETEFRKDREKTTLSAFKVGDMVMVRGEENADHSVTAKVIGTRSGGPGGGPGAVFLTGTLGKDFVAGEIKSIEAPRITVLRTDNVTQTLELNEDTTLRKGRGRESITMADIQVGDHLVARGAVQNDVFVPKGVMIMDPEQWARFQQFAAQNGSNRPAEAVPAKP